ncbi:MAG: relaxase/mobilization nuclease domain-containing protein [Ruminococcus sp.]|nr:relaxase/mobilization nuclease domain-containing protein [Ruminococcus sp.]
MAATSLHPITATQARAIAYIINPDKTEEGMLVQSYMCSENPDEAERDFLRVQQTLGTGRSKILAQHLYQSFPHGEVTPEQAFEIGKQLADRLLKGQYQYVLAVHTDKEHLHCHIVFNNTNLENGKTFETLENRNKKSWKKLREFSDALCREHDLSVIENPEHGKGKSWYEWQQDRAGLSWKTKLKFELDNCIMASIDFEDFLRQCAARNIEAVYNPDNKVNLKFRMQGQEKFTRARTLGWYYEVPQIKRRIQNFQLLKTGQLANQPRTKIIDTSQDKFQAAKGLERWADIQNMKEASRVLNILAAHQISDQKELEATAITEQSRRMKIVSDLNQMQKEIDTLSDRIKLVHAYQKYKPVHDEYGRQSPLFKKSYAKKFASDLQKFEDAKANLKAAYPDGKVPSAEVLTKRRTALIEQRNAKNDEYKSVTAELKELEYARQTVADYLKNERDVQQQKKKRNDLE